MEILNMSDAVHAWLRINSTVTEETQGPAAIFNTCTGAHHDSLYEALKYLLSSAYVPRTKLRSSRFYRRKRRHELSRTGFLLCQEQHYLYFSPLSVLLYISLWCVSFLADQRAPFHFFALFWACCLYFVNMEMIHNVNIFFLLLVLSAITRLCLLALPDMDIPFLVQYHYSA